MKGMARSQDLAALAHEVNKLLKHVVSNTDRIDSFQQDLGSIKQELQNLASRGAGKGQCVDSPKKSNEGRIKCIRSDVACSL
mmetsp:Transcript_58836/g.190486  ORF Transcript_58836/g.190486 Transcript_58836/m.190486 type:complete len:82 (+) Transcript_58836:1314-1559(+)